MAVFKVTNNNHLPVKIRDGRGFGAPSRTVYPGLPCYFKNKVRGDAFTEVEEVNNSGEEQKLDKELKAYKAAYELAVKNKKLGVRNFVDGAEVYDFSELMLDAMHTKGIDGGRKMGRKVITFSQTDAIEDDPQARAYLDRVEENASILDDAPKLPGRRD